VTVPARQTPPGARPSRAKGGRQESRAEIQERQSAGAMRASEAVQALVSGLSALVSLRGAVRAVLARADVRVGCTEATSNRRPREMATLDRTRLTGPLRQFLSSALARTRGLRTWRSPTDRGLRQPASMHLLQTSRPSRNPPSAQIVKPLLSVRRREDDAGFPQGRGLRFQRRAGIVS
jgi:hypothetical protein